MSQSREELWALYEDNLAEATGRKHVNTRTYHAVMAQLYYQLWRDAPRPFVVNNNVQHVV